MVEFLGTRIQNAREHRGLSQKEMALRINVSKGAWSLYESEGRKPSLATLVLIANELNVSTDYLLGLTRSMECK